MTKTLWFCLKTFQWYCQIISVSLTLLIKLPTQEAKSNFHKNRIYIADLKSFLNQRFDSASKLSSSKSSIPLISLFIYIKHLFVFSILFSSHLIRHSSTQSALKYTRRALKQWRYSKSTRESGTRRALRHLVTRVLKVFGHSGTLEIEELDLVDSWAFCDKVFQ